MSALTSSNSAPRPEPARAPRLPKLGGFTAFSATDYPGQLAAVLFLQGCPWRCGYCHNPHLQQRGAAGALPWPAVQERLRRRTGLIDAVVFSGGEPTAEPLLAEMIGAVRALGFKVGLHTAGAYPERLQQVLPLLDWVGIDAKTSFSGYDPITGRAGSGDAARRSATAVLASGVAHEFRTTLHPQLTPPASLRALAYELQELGVADYVWQSFRGTGCTDATLKSGADHDYPGTDLQAEIATMFANFGWRRN